METIRLLDLPNAQARHLTATGAPVYLHINPVEYHGPHLSLHTDRLISQGLTRRMHARLWPDLPLLLAGDLDVGCDPVSGPGTRSTPYSVVKSLILEAVAGLHSLGAHRVVLMTFHGSPLHNLAIQAGVDWLVAHGVPAVAPAHGLLQQLVNPDPALLDAAVLAVPERRRAAARAGLPTDFHAGTFETSLALALAPASVSPRHLDLPPCPPIVPDPTLLRACGLARALGRTALAAELRFGAFGAGWLNMRPFPGYTGQPAWASAEIGDAFADIVAEQYAALVPAVLEGRAPHPAPILAWIAQATVNGRIPTSKPLRPGELLALAS